MIASKVFKIVLAEDELPDVTMITAAIKRMNIKTSVHVVGNGQELLSYLRDGARACLPDLVIMDLKMPVMDGQTALEQIRQDDALTHLPVAILSTSDHPTDILTSYKLHANCYMQKPMRISEFDELTRAMEEFWFHKAKLPVAAS